MELFRTRLQASSNASIPEIMGGIRDMIRSNGILSLWRGLGPTLWRDVPFSATYWVFYESIKSKLDQSDHSWFMNGPLNAFYSGAISGTVSLFV